MEFTKENVATAVLVAGGLNWGLVALTERDISRHLSERGVTLPMEDTVEYPRLLYFCFFLAAVHTLLRTGNA